ncbi:Fatty-acid desaturase [Bacillus paralicheniformis]|uniref:fatty acid desaturase DesE n=1 Tax=Bacillus paralicheniformis TaxID=1648923 RepID=UPI0007414991|nr:fatty acid desaturase DesE [Bacillus paralicheniformis]KUL16746.1 fatty acid desaturase [Bacillus licheniformis LMG 6934]MBG9883651.1 fatty acid desaturase [Bacillus paralicheniformis]MBX9435681.1 fatty acid desaturase DesE [Bacillus paralicheniformis]MCY1629139.1 fatty acid desaturase DesE [Bacillus paralicheniformis]MDE1391995.1 fatty acid desaturase DesE [Bacillus paralicheniformis]
MTEQTTTHKQKQLTKQVAVFAQPDTKNSLIQLFNTFIPFFGLWFLAYLSLDVSYLLTLGITAIAAGFLTRIFIIFHDCCHLSFFKQKRHNHILGFLTGVLTLFPYLQWQHSHSIHHATSSNLDKRGTGDIWLLTVNEYKAAPLRTKIAYRLYRNPFIMFILGPIYVFLITNRFNKKGARRKERVNTYLTNLAIAALAAVCCLIFGWQSFLLVQGPIFLISGSIGVWLFYVQHTFEDSYFEADENWSYVQAAVEGSSFYKLPKLLQWLTGNIGYHHVHHLSPKVPNYKLEIAHEQHEPLKNVPTITLKTSLQSLAFRLWDEEKKQFVTFRDMKQTSSPLPQDSTEKQKLRKNA